MEINETNIFVFGSNLAGRHGAGAAKLAFDEYGAEYGQGVGRTGNTYAIPSKDSRIITMPLGQIKPHIIQFKLYAENHPELNFMVTQIGCGLAGIKGKDIAPLFRGSPDNCFFDTAWKPWLGVASVEYWGTYP